MASYSQSRSLYTPNYSSQSRIVAYKRSINILDWYHYAAALRVTHQRTSQANSGLLADGRTLANRARDEASSWRSQYRAPAPLRVRSRPQACVLYNADTLPVDHRSRGSICSSIHTILLRPTIWGHLPLRCRRQGWPTTHRN
jgi:hypothetical protein